MLQQLLPYIPPAAKNALADLLVQVPFKLKITQERKTKRGDFRPTSPLASISINNNLSKEQFLITLVHEIAHLHTYHNHGKVKPHGTEWKTCFQQLMLPFLHPSVFKPELLSCLAQHLKNPKATTDSDPKLSLLLMKKKQKENHNYFIFELNPEDLFCLNQRIYKILHKRRTRYLCIEIKTQKKYLIHQNAEVQKI
ncbi:SprT-like domain-containing protein [Ochrovirga pacifica]|uniref:SprT-like domain-containing protein n=1 Tax=Ochrovirga pacifica TaxID=1042376 RepID=UPI0002557FC7|nr:SprT-like domain-containing protein [Ochrovirga pacifica]